MKKNTAGQYFTVSLVDANTGASFNGTVYVVYKGDNGTLTQGANSITQSSITVSGVIIYEYTYSPTQAETNFGYVVFTIFGTGAVPQDVRCWTTFPQSADVGAGVSLVASQHVIVDSGTVTSITNDVGITQAGADKVWGSTTRTLTSFGTLVADTAAAAATAVWAAGSRTLTAFGFTVPATIADKTGYSLSTAGVQAFWDALLTALTTTGSIGKKLADWTVNADTSGTGTLLTRLTANRAGYLDNLSAGAVAQAASLPANFATLGISSEGKINGVVLADTTTTLTDAPGIRSAVGLATANLDTQLAALGSAIPGPAPSADSIVQHLLDVDTTGHTTPNSPTVLWRNDVMAKLPSDYADGQLGQLIGKLNVGTPTDPVYVLPSPPAAADKCRVVGYFTGVSMQIPLDSTVLFELVTLDDAPTKSSRIAVGRTVTASLNVDGILTDGTNLWLDLERNDTLSPSGSYWRVTFADARLTRKTFQLNNSVFDLATLVT